MSDESRSERPHVHWQWFSDLRGELQQVQGKIQEAKETYTREPSPPPRYKPASAHIPRISSKLTPKKGALGFKGSARRRLLQMPKRYQPQPRLDPRLATSQRAGKRQSSISKCLLSEMQIRSRQVPKEAQDDWPGQDYNEQEEQFTCEAIVPKVRCTKHRCLKPRMKSAQLPQIGAESHVERRRSKSADSSAERMKSSQQKSVPMWSQEASRPQEEDGETLARRLIQFDPEIAGLSVSDDLKWRMLFPHQSLRQNQLVGDQRGRPNPVTPRYLTQVTEAPPRALRVEPVPPAERSKGHLPKVELYDWKESGDSALHVKSSPLVYRNPEERQLSKSSVRLCKLVKQLQEKAKEKEQLNQQQQQQPMTISQTGHVRNKVPVMMTTQVPMSSPELPQKQVISTSVQEDQCPNPADLHNPNPYIRSAARRQLTVYLRSQCKRYTQTPQQTKDVAHNSKKVVCLPRLEEKASNALVSRSGPSDAARFAYTRGTLGFPECQYPCVDTPSNRRNLTYMNIAHKL